LINISPDVYLTVPHPKYGTVLWFHTAVYPCTMKTYRPWLVTCQMPEMSSITLTHAPE